MALGEGLEHLLLNWKSLFPRGCRWKALLVPSIILIPILFHPVWDLFLSPRHFPDLEKKYGEGTSSSIRLTTARDWFLLNEKGQHWLNSWYYDSAPILMERDRVTVFQPMVVALVGPELKAWKDWLGVHFSSPNTPWSQPIFFLEASEPSELDSPLFKDEVDYVILDSSLADKDLSHLWPKDSYCYFHRGIWKEADGQLRHDQNTFRADKELFSDGYFFHTPLIKRRDLIRKQGLDPEQTKLTTHYKTLLFQILSQPVWMGSLGLFGGLGFLICLAWVISPFAAKRSYLLPAIGIILSILQPGMWKDSLQYRLLNDENNFWDQHEILKVASFTLNASDVKLILSQPETTDARLRMLRWLAIGRAYPKMPQDIKLEIVKKLSPDVENYSKIPFNLRYKLLDACAKILPLHGALKKFVSEEEHPYVRWYARDKGFDGT